MPELPEVETIKNDLRPVLEGRRIIGVSIAWARMVQKHSPEEFSRLITGRLVERVGRRGKYLVFSLAGGDFLVFHLRMTGALLLGKREEASLEPERYVTAILNFEGGIDLIFRDRRKLGTIGLLGDLNELERKLGPEPLDAGFTVDVMKDRLDRRKAPIKAVLCDQKFVAGVGNMYADDALFAAGLHPLRQADSLSGEEIERLHSAIRKVLEKGIANAGATFSDYLRPGGERGRQQEEFQVAHRGGETCKVCSTPVERIAVRERGTYFCPRCQAPTCS